MTFGFLLADNMSSRKNKHCALQGWYWVCPLLIPASADAHTSMTSLGYYEHHTSPSLQGVSASCTSNKD